MGRVSGSPALWTWSHGRASALPPPEAPVALSVLNQTTPTEERAGKEERRRLPGTADAAALGPRSKPCGTRLAGPSLAH